MLVWYRRAANSYLESQNEVHKRNGRGFSYLDTHVNVTAPALCPVRKPKEHAELIESLWTQGSVLGHVEKNNPARVVFGTDEFAGDREIACFLATAAAMAEIEAAAAAQTTACAAATAELSVSGTAEAHTLERWSLLPPEAGSILVAVPLHAGDLSRRYNPYHLRIVDRVVEGGGRQGRREGTKEMFDGDHEISGNWNGEELPEKASLSETRVTFALDSGGGERGCYKKEPEQAPGYEKKCFGVEEERRECDVERAYFSLQGVTFVNVHGETSFQSLEEWRLEKERFDHLYGMSFVRG